MQHSRPQLNMHGHWDILTQAHPVEVGAEVEHPGDLRVPENHNWPFPTGAIQHPSAEDGFAELVPQPGFGPMTCRRSAVAR